MGYEKFAAGSLGFIVLMNLVITAAPGPVGDLTSLNTSALESQTDMSTNVNSNQTSESNVVDQAEGLVAFYSNPDPQNRMLSKILTVYSAIFILILIDLIWIG